MTNKKKILIVADLPTHPIDGGNKMCIIQNAELLRNLGYDVYFLLYNRDSIPQHQIEATKDYWGDHFLYFATTGINRFIWKVKNRFIPHLRGKVDFYTPRKLLRFVNKAHSTHKFSGMIVNYIWMSRLAECNIPTKAIYTHDVFSNRAQRIASSYKWMSFSPNEEALALQRFKYVLAIQNIEAQFFKYLTPTSEVITIYSPVNFVDQPIENNKNILFFSGGGELNLLGIRWFINEIFPLIKEIIPEAKLLIGGKICSTLNKNELPVDVELTGLYDNPSDFYAKGNIVINPIYSGSGLKIKTIEAIAHGKWVVVHPHSAEGIYKQSTAPLQVAKFKEDFAQKVFDGFNSISLELWKRDCQDYIGSYNFYISEIYKQIFL